jgi:two-component sensor histidine kinase
MKKGINWKSVSLITAIVTTITTAVAQPDTVRIASLLKAGSDYVLRPGNEKSDLDSAQFFFNQALALSESIRSDKWINETLKWKGDCYLEGNDLAPGEACFQQVIDYYHRKRDLSHEAKTWSRLGVCITTVSPRFAAEKVKCFRRSYLLFLSLGDSLKAMEALKYEADAHLYEPNLDLAEKELLTVVEGYKSLHFRHLQYTYDLLRGVAKLKGDLFKELFYSMEMIRSLDSADAKDDTALVGLLYYSAGISYSRAGLWDRALFYTRKGWLRWTARDWSRGLEDRFVMVNSLTLIMVHLDSAREAMAFLSAAVKAHPPTTEYERAIVWLARGLCYTTLGDFEKAEKDYLQLVTFVKHEKALNRRTILEMDLEAILAIGTYYLLCHRRKEADFYARQLPPTFSYLISLELRERIERFRFRVDSSLGRYQSALQHNEVYHRIKDSLFGVQKSIQIQELQMKYAVDQMNNDIRLKTDNIQLLTKENLVQHSQVRQSRTLRNMMIIGIFFLLLLVGLTYNRYRLKQQKNHQLEAKQREITDKNLQLERLLNENEWLLREVHHRVKNNLQVIISLLKSQSDFLHDKAALAAVVESEHRVYAMSLIHQKLYKSTNVSTIDMAEYIGDLAEYLRYCFQGSGKLWFDLQVEPIKLDLKQAVPVGLILNEVITNSFKYAFPWSEEDKITVRLFASGNGWLSLMIADNGRGLPPNFDPSQHNSFGMLLIAGLTEDLEGTLHIETRQGTAFHIRFKQMVTTPLSEEGSGGPAYFNR